MKPKKCVVSIYNFEKCIICGKEVVAKIVKGQIQVYSYCSYDLGEDIQKTIDQVNAYLDLANKELEEMK